MVVRWAILFGDILIMAGLVSVFGLLHLSVWQAVVSVLVGFAGVVIGLQGNEDRARNYFQVVAIAAGVGLVMALGASLAGAGSLLGVPLNVGSFMLFFVVLAATFFAGFEPEAIEEPTGELLTQRY